jgi:hypothetical protein
MRITTFLCPNTGVWLQTWCANNGSEDNNETYERVTCIACRQLHMVNPRTGNVLGFPHAHEAK